MKGKNRLEKNVTLSLDLNCIVGEKVSNVVFRPTSLLPSADCLTIKLV